MEIQFSFVLSNIVTHSVNSTSEKSVEAPYPRVAYKQYPRPTSKLMAEKGRVFGTQ